VFLAAAAKNQSWFLVCRVCVCVCVRCLGFGFVGFVGFFVGCCWQQKASSDGGRYTRRASALGVQQHGVPTAGLVE
jgi:hypothetical protein